MLTQRTYQEINQLTRDQLVREVMATEQRCVRVEAKAECAVNDALRVAGPEVARLEAAVLDAHAEIARLSKALEAAHAAQANVTSAEISKLRAQVSDLKSALKDKGGRG